MDMDFRSSEVKDLFEELDNNECIDSEARVFNDFEFRFNVCRHDDTVFGRMELEDLDTHEVEKARFRVRKEELGTKKMRDLMQDWAPK